MQAFVERGGALLLLADHTDLREQLQPTNALLEPWGIRLRDDSAVSTDPGGWWTGTIAASDHPAAGPRFAGPDYGVSVGASLDVAAPAVPLLSGRTAFSDAPDRQRQGGLGDLQRQPEDRHGGLTLAALAEPGDGRVLVFGDTSTFQDGALLSSLAFSDHAVTYLLAGTRSVWPRQLVVLAALVVLVTGAGLRTGRATVPPWAAAASLVGAGGGALLEHAEVLPLAVDELTWVDLGHTGLAHVRDSADHDLLAMARGFSRYGELTAIAWAGDLTDALARGGRRLVLPAPEAEFTPDELTAIETFAADGGDVWILARRRHRERSPALFEHFGIEIPDDPLGAAVRVALVDGDRTLSPQEAWPIELDGARTLAAGGERPFAVELPLGRGRLVVVGDAEIFLGSQLERTWRVNQANAQLFRVLMGEAVADIPEPPPTPVQPREPTQRSHPRPLAGGAAPGHAHEHAEGPGHAHPVELPPPGFPQAVPGAIAPAPRFFTPQAPGAPGHVHPQPAEGAPGHAPHEHDHDPGQPAAHAPGEHVHEAEAHPAGQHQFSAPAGGGGTR